MPTPVLNGLILIGGKSARMGFDKATLEYHGEAQARYAYHVLSPLCTNTFLSSRTECAFNEVFKDLPLLEDQHPEIGPLAGLMTAMETYPDTAWLVLACDMPHADESVLQRLVEARNPEKHATAYQLPDGAPEPYCAIYEPACLALFTPFYNIGRTRLPFILESFDLELLELPSEQALLRATTPTDYMQQRPRA